MMKSWLGFGDLDQIFKVTAGLKLPNLSPKVLVCTISHELVGRWNCHHRLVWEVGDICFLCYIFKMNITYCHLFFFFRKRRVTFRFPVQVFKCVQFYVPSVQYYANCERGNIQGPGVPTVWIYQSNHRQSRLFIWWVWVFKYTGRLSYKIYVWSTCTVMILSFRTDMPGQTEEQSDQGPHCLPIRLHRLDSLLYGRAT